MLFYYAGLRRSDMKALPGFPPRLLFTFDDVGPTGGGEQKTLFRQLLKERKCGSTTAGKKTSPAPKSSSGTKQTS